VKFYFIGTEFLYDYNANLSKAVAAKLSCERLNFHFQPSYPMLHKICKWVILLNLVHTGNLHFFSNSLQYSC